MSKHAKITRLHLEEACRAINRATALDAAREDPHLIKTVAQHLVDGLLVRVQEFHCTDGSVVVGAFTPRKRRRPRKTKLERSVVE